MTMPADPARSQARGKTRLALFAAGYAALIVYGSLYPFTGLDITNIRLFGFLSVHWPANYSRADVVTNVLAYIPLGLFLALWWRGPRSLAAPVILATMAGTSLSFFMELLQQFTPSRVASVMDLATNACGTFLGAVLAGFLRTDSSPGRVLMQLRNGWIKPGRLFDAGLIAIAGWALSQVTPLVPSLDVGNLRHGLAPLWHTLHRPELFSAIQWAVYALYIAGLALLSRTLGIPGRPAVSVFFAFVAAVLLYKIPAVGRQLSLEALAGALVAVLLTLPCLALRLRASAWMSAVLIVAGFTIAEFASAPAGIHHPFNWVPFRGQMENPLIGIAVILEVLWPAAALAYLVRIASAPAHRTAFAWVGGVALGLVVFELEWYQQFLPGRYGDITTVFLMTGTWVLFWIVSADAPGAVSAEEIDPSPARLAKPESRAWAVAGVLGLTALTAVGALVLGNEPVEFRADESKLPQLPAPEELPPVALPGFRFAHPRLPSPDTYELVALEIGNPAFVRQVRNLAKGGKGDMDAAALQELLDPGSVDLDLLQRRLMALKFSWRGHEQGKPLALAYDWLYPRWSESQRAELRGKLVEGCNYLIERIRKERQSPYNVILYNAPFQALMACTLAIYGDDPRGDAIMRFTYDLWKNRVLPVWRQVMGRNGGWHEGGEYVGIGIGQAIHELPAMWRSATGEDLFATEPGIRGFLDFLVYRTRPDGTHFRWGDGAFFDKIVPDAIPLALEFRHAPAYNLRPPRKEPVPSGWPWGLLTDPTLLDVSAVSRLPLMRYFDGIGMLVARSDWTPQATYVTFKAGDNFWSHVHLDQGAFTIYKGGELAIDSGLYGPAYGSDHHMNYTYQTVAHNTITVTDPDDTVPAPGKDKPRPIANDGGQRRIGSGWGVEPAPLDRAEWEAKRDIYRTATMEPIFDRDELTVAVADITPAYTNERSGNRTFSHRTRRVERFWRTFGYDRLDDVVVVFDQVTATKASFRKRWLLHTIEAPLVTPKGFSVNVSSQDRIGHAGGRLEGTVLLPKEASILAIGGRGFEFFVDDRNYDENGTLQNAIKKLGPNNGEPGAWRIEVSPSQDAPEDLFLVVLLPTAAGEHPTHQVRLLESGNRVGCEIIGPKRTTRWWFAPGRNGAVIEVSASGEGRRYQVEGQAAPTPEQGWFDRVRSWISSRQ